MKTMGFALALGIAIVGQVLYQVTQKTVHAEAHPVLALIAFYLVAAVLSLPLFFLFPLQGPLSAGLSQLNVSVLGVALSIVLIELGFLLAYRAGGSLSSTYVLSASVVACVVLGLGALFFKEAITVSKLAGIGLCFSGIWLLTRPTA